jgi:hypothetical protein
MKKITTLGIAALAAGAGALVLILAAWPQSSADAKKDYCNSLNNLSSTVMSYQGLNPATATNEELDNAAGDISDAYDQVIDDANDWANAYDNPLTEAYDNLYWAIQALPSDYTVAEDLSSLDNELSAFPQAFRDTFDGSGCSSS